MRRERAQWALLLTLAVAVAGPARAQGPELAGLWKTEKETLVRISPGPDGLVLRLLNPGACAASPQCPLGGGAPVLGKGKLEGRALVLQLTRCTHDPDMRAAGLAPHWSAPCTVTTVTENLVVGTWRSEFYEYDVKDGKKVNFRRKPSGDSEYPFTLTRARFRPELQDLVTRIDRLADKLREHRQAFQDAERRATAAREKLLADAGAQLKPGTFRQGFPAAVKVETALTRPRGLEELTRSWADLTASLGAREGDWAAEKADRLPRLAALAGEWQALLASGQAAISETDTAQRGLFPDHAAGQEIQRARVNALAEYAALRELCAVEIPMGTGPMPREDASWAPDPATVRRLPPGAPHPDRTAADAAVKNAAAQLLDAQAALGELQSLLSSHPVTDPQKPLSETLGRAPLLKLSGSLLRASRGTAASFRALHEAEAARARLLQSLGSPPS